MASTVSIRMRVARRHSSRTLSITTRMKEFLRTLPASIAWIVTWVGAIMIGLRHGDLLSLIITALGFGLLVTVSLVTGRILIRRSSETCNFNNEVSRDEEPIFFWIIVAIFTALLGCMIILISRALKA